MLSLLNRDRFCKYLRTVVDCNEPTAPAGETLGQDDLAESSYHTFLEEHEPNHIELESIKFSAQICG